MGATLRDAHGADVLVLGCAGRMARYRARFEDQLGIAVVDPSHSCGWHGGDGDQTRSDQLDASGGLMSLPGPGRFPYSAIVDRPDFDWPGGKRLAVYVALNLEHFAFGEERPGRRVGARRTATGRPQLGVARVRQPGRSMAHAGSFPRLRNPAGGAR